MQNKFLQIISIGIIPGYSSDLIEKRKLVNGISLVGVLGAFMSLMNITFLNEAINQKNIKEVDEVFNYVRERHIENLGKDGQKDGFDDILACLKKDQTK